MVKQTLWKCITSYVGMVVLFTLLMIGVTSTPKAAVSDHIVSSTKVLEEEGLYKEFFNFKLFQMDNFTDSYMLNLIASADDKKPVEAAMMNYDYKSKNFMDLAYDTENVANGNMKGLERESYGRYWHGYQVTLKPMLTVMDYSSIRILNYVLFAVLIVTCIVLMAKKVGKGAAALFAVALLVINFPLVPLSLQFSTCFYIALIGMIAVMAFPRLTSSDSSLLCTFFILGGVTSFMDFLTTPQLTLGLPMIAYLLSCKDDKKWKKVILICVFWGLGYGCVWASKWLVGYLLTGNNILADAMKSAELRTSDSYKGMHMTIPGIITFIWEAVKERHLVAPFVAGIFAVVVMIGVYVKSIKSKSIFKQYSYLLLIALIVPVWFLVLRNHSIQHGWFTWRAGLLSLYSVLLLVYYTGSWKNIVKSNKKNNNE